MDKQNNIPEAVASVTYTIETATGFNCLFTVRDVSGLELLNKMPGIEAKFAELGIKPQVKRSFGAKPKVYVEGKKCPKCGGGVVEGRKKDGSIFHKCEHQKYFNGVVSGCDYTDWLNPPKDQKMTVEEYENYNIPEQ